MKDEDLNSCMAAAPAQLVNYFHAIVNSSTARIAFAERSNGGAQIRAVVGMGYSDLIALRNLIDKLIKETDDQKDIDGAESGLGKQVPAKPH